MWQLVTTCSMQLCPACGGRAALLVARATVAFWVGLLLCRSVVGRVYLLSYSSVI